MEINLVHLLNNPRIFKTKNTMKKRKIARDSITGKIVTLKYAKQNPTTTTVETIEIKEK